MSRTIMLIPTGTSVGLTSVSLGVIRAMERKGVRLSVFKPIAQPRAGGDAPDQTTTIVRKNSNLPAAEPLKMSHVESLLSSNQKDVLMEEIIANYHANTQDAEVVLVSKGESVNLSERRIPISEFFVDYRKTALEPGEILKTIIIPRPQFQRGLTRKLEWYKVSKRREMDISTVAGCFAPKINFATR